MSKMKDEWFDEFYYQKREYDTPQWHEPNGGYTKPNKTVGKHGNHHPKPINSKPTTNKHYANFSFSTKLNDKEFLDNLIEQVEKCLVTFVKKHEDYGPTNIANAPGGAINGLAVRLHDKIARLSNMQGKKTEPNYESLYDTFMDIANYGIIGMLVLEGKWDKG